MSDQTAPGDEGSRPRSRWRFLRRRRHPRGERRRRLPFDLRKALFILPNAFTVASIFCGFYSIILSTSGDGPEVFDKAGIALFFAAFFDAFDGRIARLTRTQSDFGMQMDSLADAMSFGLAPAVLVYEWALKPLGEVGLVISFAFCACGVIRLARFNVLAIRGVGSSKYFMGLPIPGASSMLVSVIVAQSHNLGTTVEKTSSVAVLVVILSYLMVSRIRFRTFKDFRPRMKTLPLLLAILVAVAIAVLILKARLALVFAVGGYVSLGLVEEVVFFKKRRLQDLEQKQQAAAATTTPTATATATTTPTAPLLPAEPPEKPAPA
ncbi:MAG: CDP-diacylglycerol--serine O-phosphatidyltransferase [Deltaproteobacteria bacterium]|nr:CDP-diacylglycerol--serine O-phosphatidyltransferase [Deltaproteobacteria bacterium]